MARLVAILKNGGYIS